MDSLRVVVAGAGLAGLAAAHELANAGADVVVVEARQRAGGRVWTVRDGFDGGQHAELGGEFVDEDHRRIRALVDRFGLTLVRVLGGGFTQRLHPAGGMPVLRRTGGWDALAGAVAPLIRRYKAARTDDASSAVREMSTFSLRDWLRHQRANAEAHAAADALRGFFVAEPDDLSVLQVVEQLADGDAPIRTRMFRIAGGNDRLLDAMIAATPATFLFGRVVRRVVQSGTGVTVSLDDGRGGLSAIEGDALVMALPATRVRLLEFEPALPERQHHAIATLQYGCATKVVIQSRSAGLSRHRAKAFATDGVVGAFWDSTEGQPSESHSMLTFFGGGRTSASLRSLAEASAGALLSPTCWLGKATSPAGAGHRAWASWEQEEYSGGGYAYLDPAFDPSQRRLLSRRSGRVVFAGEHTSDDWQGYMEGAIQSGIAAARKLLARAA